MTTRFGVGVPRWLAFTVVLGTVIASSVALIILLDSGTGDLIVQGPAAVDPDLGDELAVLFNPTTIATIQRLLHIAGLVVFFGLAAFILVKSHTTRTANLAALTLATLGASLFAPLIELPGGDWVARVVGSITPEYLPGFWGSLAGLSLLGFLGTFPDGRWTPAWSRWPLILALVSGVSSLLWPGSPLNPTNWPFTVAIVWLTGLPVAMLLAQAIRSRSQPLTQANRPVVISLIAMIVAFVVLWATQPELTEGAFDLVVVTPRLSALYAVNILIVLTIATFLFPVAVSFSIVRYRLFDVDLLVNRALVYSIVTAVVGGTFLALAVAVSFFANVELSSDLSGQVAGPLGVALGVFVVVVFQPLRRRVQTGVDRRFYRERYNAQRLIDDFSGQVTRVVSPEELAANLTRVVDQAVHPVSVAFHNGPFTQATESALSAGVAVDKADLTDLPAESVIDLGNKGVVVPLLASGSLTGVLELGERASGSDYSKLDLDLLDRLAKSAGPALQLAYEVQIREQMAIAQQRAANELDLARKIQQGLLPKGYPELSGWSFNAFYQPAREVGGDFYDWISLPDGRLGIVIGDVSDKGIPAALVMATCRTLLRSAAGTGVDPGELLADVNDRLQPDIPSGMFVTCLVAFLDPTMGSITMANAGHNLPYLCHGSQVDELMVRGMPLGLMPGMEYEEIRTTMNPGGVIVLSSDGLAESHCDGEMFGTGRVEDSLRNTPVDPLAAALDAHRRFVGADWEQEDDMTLVTVGRAGRAEAMSQPEELDSALI